MLTSSSLSNINKAGCFPLMKGLMLELLVEPSGMMGSQC